MFAINTKGLLAAVLTLTLSSAALADSSIAAEAAPSGQASTTSIGSMIASKAKASYFMEFFGMNGKAIDGQEGGGSDLTINHYGSVGWKLSNKWTVKATQAMQQRIRKKVEGQDDFIMTDPYFTFSNSKIASSDKYGTNLAGYVRYYAPFSRATNQNVGTANDQGNGAIRLLVAPSKTFMDGALTISCPSFIQYRLNKSTAQERSALNNGDSSRIDYRAFINPIVAYSLSAKTEAYLEFGTNYINHSTKGTWSNIQDVAYISPGLNLSPAKKVLVNPYVAWDVSAIQLNKASIGVNAQYTFL